MIEVRKSKKENFDFEIELNSGKQYFTKLVFFELSNKIEEVLKEYMTERVYIPLEDIKENVSLITDKNVFIYSSEHGCFWRQNSNGYTKDICSAGIYDFKDAYEKTNHCGREKGIQFIEV
jgi:hypothetical protein